MSYIIWNPVPYIFTILPQLEQRKVHTRIHGIVNLVFILMKFHFKTPLQFYKSVSSASAFGFSR